MQLNTLNRVIALFLIGGLVMVMAAVAYQDQIVCLLTKYSAPGLGPSAGAFLAVGLLSITALAGTVVDAVGNITVCLLVRKFLARRRGLAVWFLCADAFDEQDSWRTPFKDALEGSPRYKAVANNEDMVRGVSAGIFLRTAGKEHLEWLLQHYSMYHLATSFVIIFIPCAIWSFRTGHYCITAGTISGAYLLMGFALDNYLFTYEMSFRNAYLALADVHDADLKAEVVAREKDAEST